MAIALRNGLRLGGINEFARESCSVGPVSKAAGLTNEFNFGTKRIELKWQLKCTSKDSNHVISIFIFDEFPAFLGLF
jgi:hypothetical protein